MYIDIESEIQNKINQMRLEEWITLKMANTRRNWHPKILKYEKRKEDKYYKMALSWILFSN